jgi:hypothetical protein
MRFIQGGDWESVSVTPIDATALAEIERLTRSYIRHLLEKDIKSFAWLDSLKQCPSASSGADNISPDS